MTNQELIDTLRKASESQDKDNIALRMLLIMAAERMERLHLALYGEKMNQRIQELMEQAGIFENQYTTEKFAQLIVRECCDWIDGSPANDAGQLHLTKSFIIANLKGMFRSKE